MTDEDLANEPKMLPNANRNNAKVASVPASVLMTDPMMGLTTRATTFQRWSSRSIPGKRSNRMKRPTKRMSHGAKHATRGASDRGGVRIVTTPVDVVEVGKNAQADVVAIATTGINPSLGANVGTGMIVRRTMI